MQNYHSFSVDCGKFERWNMYVTTNVPSSPPDTHKDRRGEFQTPASIDFHKTMSQMMTYYTSFYLFLLLLRYLDSRDFSPPSRWCSLIRT
jgi:hypothetical protein